MAKKQRGYILILPSLFTTGNLFCGYYAIMRAFHHDFELACYAIILAGVFDVLDGRVARITRSQTKFGLEYDSIADVVSFGLAPAVIAYMWGLESFGRVGFAISFFFAACGALRLARFNTITDETPKSYFVGLPIPAAANAIVTTILAQQAGAWAIPERGMLALCAILALLMVSSVRYRSAKDLDLRHKRSFFPLVIFVSVIAFMAAQPELGMCVVVLGYVAYGPFRELLSWAKHIKSHRKELEKGSEET